MRVMVCPCRNFHNFLIASNHSLNYRLYFIETHTHIHAQALNTRMETVLTSIQSLFEDLIERMGKLDDDS